MRTLVELLEQSVRRWSSLPATQLHGRNPWGWSYAELGDSARRVAAYLRGFGVSKGDRVVIWGASRPEWVAGFFGIQWLGAIAVPLDTRSPEDLLTRIESETQPKHMLIGKEQAAALKQRHAPHTLLDDLREKASTAQPLTDGGPNVAPDDIAELVFTSGTTGNPKGVILAHRNIAANALMSADAVPPTPKNRVLSILPLSHMFEQTGGLFTPMVGGASLTYISSLRPDVIFDALTTHRITNMSCVPQVLQLFKDGIEREVRRQNKMGQFEKLRAVSKRLPLAARRLLFRKVRQRMGGAFDFFVVGGAFLDPDLARWWESLGFKVIQGYGMTEASPVVSSNRLNDRDAESVGKPVKGVEIKIADDLEILVRGDNVSPGYWNNPQATADAFENGWYKTGDLGQFDKTGRLRLRGRKKNMIVLSNGMNVYPEDLERALTADPRVKDAVVLGLTKGQDVEIHAVLLTTEPEGAPDAVKAANAMLSAHQHIHGFTVWPDEAFPLTPTLKPKRADIAARLAELHSQKAKA